MALRLEYATYVLGRPDSERQRSGYMQVSPWFHNINHIQHSRRYDSYPPCSTLLPKVLQEVLDDNACSYKKTERNKYSNFTIGCQPPSLLLVLTVSNKTLLLPDLISMPVPLNPNKHLLAHYIHQASLKRVFAAIFQA